MRHAGLENRYRQSTTALPGLDSSTSVAQVGAIPPALTGREREEEALAQCLGICGAARPRRTTWP